MQYWFFLQRIFTVLILMILTWNLRFLTLVRLKMLFKRKIRTKEIFFVLFLLFSFGTDELVFWKECSSLFFFCSGKGICSSLFFLVCKVAFRLQNSDPPLQGKKVDFQVKNRIPLLLCQKVSLYRDTSSKKTLMQSQDKKNDSAVWILNFN